MIDLPGTSSVSRSLRTPKLHFSGLVLFSISSSDRDMFPGLGTLLDVVCTPRNRLHLGLLSLRDVARSGSASCWYRSSPAFSVFASKDEAIVTLAAIG